jgi:hypothetical protein
MKTGFTMKALSLAVLSLAGLGFGASAFAACPTNLLKTDAPAGAWDAKATLGGALVISAGGFNTTSCKLDSSITVNGPGVSAFVRDNTPTAEPHYRLRFFVNADALTGLNSIQSAKIFSANTDTPFLSISEAVKLSVFGNLAGTAKTLGVSIASQGAPSNLFTDSIPLAPGVNSIQIDWVKGASATVKVWVNSTTEASPTKTYPALNTNGWVVDYATLGLSTPSPNFRASHLNQIVSFDEFDSRRTSFIN